MKQLEKWINHAKHNLKQGVYPDQYQYIMSSDNQQLDLFSTDPENIRQEVDHCSEFKISNDFLDLADMVLCHRDQVKYKLLYRLFWRIQNGEKNLIKIDPDPDVRRAQLMRKQVGRDLHKMKAFVRFKKMSVQKDMSSSLSPHSFVQRTSCTSPHSVVKASNLNPSDHSLSKFFDEIYVAWYEPDHLITERISWFFVNRFRAMNWMICTPDRCAIWDQKKIHFKKGLSSKIELADQFDEMWKTYYASIFNPARVKIKAMKNEMPVRFWKNLPEAELIPELIKNAEKRVEGMKI